MSKNCLEIQRRRTNQTNCTTFSSYMWPSVKNQNFFKKYPQKWPKKSTFSAKLVYFLKKNKVLQKIQTFVKKTQNRLFCCYLFIYYQNPIFRTNYLEIRRRSFKQANLTTFSSKLNPRVKNQCFFKLTPQKWPRKSTFSAIYLYITKTLFFALIT